MKSRLVVILGPTASRKSDVAVRAAHLLNGEIVSADSRQVYKGLDIGTGKITEAEMQGVPHHLLDIADPRTVFTVSDYKSRAEEAIDDILSRDKLPILCGGTGLYINAVIDNLVIPEVPPNQELREELADKSVEELYERLLARDPRRAAAIDPKNPRRLVRALEVSSALGAVPELSYGAARYNPIIVGLQIDPKELSVRIQKRLDDRLAHGMVQEAEKLHAHGLTFDRMKSLGLEYKYLALHIEGELSHEEMRQELFRAIVAYSKRQITWFKKDPRVVWLTPPQILPYLEHALQALFESR